jgi:hypothetical protein
MKDKGGSNTREDKYATLVKSKPQYKKPRTGTNDKTNKESKNLHLTKRKGSSFRHNYSSTRPMAGVSTAV